MNAKEIANELNEALELVAMIKVSHEAVDVMAAAKQKIRMVIAALNESESYKATPKSKGATDNG